jgi:hypothetical protein
MYAHSVIAALQEHLEIWDSLQDKDPNREKVMSHTRKLVDGIKRSKKFYLRDVGDYNSIFKSLDKFPLFYSDVGEIRTPYPECYFDYDISDIELREGETACTRRAHFVKRIAEKDGSHTLAVSSLYYVDLAKTWVVHPFVYGVRNGVFASDEVKKEVKGGKDYYSLNVGYDAPVLPVPLVDPDVLGKETSLRMIKENTPDLFVLQSALLLLNCKNVTTRSIYPSRKLNKKRERNKKVPIDTYKVLELILPSEYSENAKGEPTGERRPLHWRRGHWKFFNPPGLFGKYTGLFWWKEHMAGSKSEGEVHKDYAISNANH